MPSNLSTVQSIPASPRCSPRIAVCGALSILRQPLRQGLHRSACSLVMPWFTQGENMGPSPMKVERR